MPISVRHCQSVRNNVGSDHRGSTVFLYLFIRALFNDALNSSKYIAFNDKTISIYLIFVYVCNYNVIILEVYF
jgi:hypothetical protein